MTQTKTGPLFGYARASTADQNLDLQLDAIEAYGVERTHIFADKAGISDIKGRNGFRNALKVMGPGAVLVVWRLDRLGRNLSELILTIELLKDRGAELVSLNESFDTSTDTGRLMYQLVGMFAQCERDLISERKRAGLIAARERGASVGRSDVLAPGSETRSRVVQMLAVGESIASAAKAVGVSRSRLYREKDALRAEAAEIELEDLDGCNKGVGEEK